MQTSVQCSTAGGKKGPYHYQALVPEEQEGVHPLLTLILLIFTVELYPDACMLYMHTINMYNV